MLFGSLWQIVMGVGCGERGGCGGCQCVCE